jgi:hypothetical protein
VPLVREHLGHRLPDVHLIVHHQNTRHHLQE